MDRILNRVKWLNKSEMMENLLIDEPQIVTEVMNQGFEAQVVKVSIAGNSYVLKTWNKESSPDIHFQYNLLKVLYNQGLPVAQPKGWGIDENGHKVLLTTFVGFPIGKLKIKQIAALSTILLKIHHVDIKQLTEIKLPLYHFQDYYFSSLDEQDKLNIALKKILLHIEIKQNSLIHGDFHLWNVLEQDGIFTIIDWTNGQLGDARYDFAWAHLTIKLYLSNRYAEVFRSTYLQQQETDQKTLNAFEALACLRWIYLYKKNAVPLQPKTIKEIKGIVKNNVYLIDYKFDG